MLVTCARTERPHGALLQFGTGTRYCICLLYTSDVYKRQAYIHASKEVAKVVDTLEGDEKTGAKVVLKALEAPLFHIAANAGPVSYTHLIQKERYQGKEKPEFLRAVQTLSCARCV